MFWPQKGLGQGKGRKGREREHCGGEGEELEGTEERGEREEGLRWTHPDLYLE